MIGQFVSMLFLARDLAHIEHLRVRGPGSYAAHQALGDFYNAVVDLADSLIEAYQGRTGNQVQVERFGDTKPQNIITTLEAQLKWLEANRYEAAPEDDTPLQSIVDEIATLYLRTLYKLKNLQ